MLLLLAKSLVYILNSRCRTQEWGVFSDGSSVDCQCGSGQRPSQHSGAPQRISSPVVVGRHREGSAGILQILEQNSFLYCIVPVFFCPSSYGLRLWGKEL